MPFPVDICATWFRLVPAVQPLIVHPLNPAHRQVCGEGRKMQTRSHLQPTKRCAPICIQGCHIIVPLPDYLKVFFIYTHSAHLSATDHFIVVVIRLLLFSFLPQAFFLN